MNIITKNEWELCFGDENHDVEIVRGAKEEVTNYLNSFKAQTWEGGCERIDNYINNELEDDSTTIIFFNYDKEVFAVISLDGFKKKLETVCTEGNVEEINYLCSVEDFNKFAKKNCLEHGTLELRGDGGKIIEINGFFSEGRVFDYELPEGYIKFVIRGSDDDDSIYATLEKFVRVNYACTFITNDKTILPLVEERQYLEIDDWDYGGYVVTDGGDDEAEEENKPEKQEVWVLIHEYSDRDEEGASALGVFKSFEKARAKAKLLAENEIKDSPWKEEDIYYQENESNFYITYNGGCYYDNYKVEMTFMED